MGYLCHLIQDRLWFSDYVTRVAIKESEEVVIYRCDNSVHYGNEYRKDIYDDYSNIDSTLYEELNVDIKDIREMTINYFKDDIFTNIVNKEIIVYNFDKSRKNRLLTLDIAREYIDEATKNCEDFLDCNIEVLK